MTPGPLPPSRARVGVDVVDLSAARTLGRSRDERFLARVYAPGERERIEAAADPDLEVWRLWAAKEAAFKVVSKLVTPIPAFRHAAFRVVDGPGSPPRRLRFEEAEILVEVAEGVGGGAAGGEPARFVVAIAENPVTSAHTVHSGVVTLTESANRFEVDPAAGGSQWAARVGGRFTQAELDAVHGLASALVRLEARRAASRLLGVDETRLQIVCPEGHTGLRPPFLHLDGGRLEEVDVSLSHDGQHVAWALRIPGGG